MTHTGNAATTRGSAGRPASAAAWRSVGTMWSCSVFGPTHHVDVPSASVAGDAQHLRAERGDEHGRARAARDADAAVDPELLAVEAPPCPSRAAASAPTGTRAGGGPACRTTSPTSTRRRSGATARCRARAGRRIAACTVSACWASIIGCRGYVGTTAVPSSIAGHLAADDREHGQRVVAEDLRRPVRVQPVVGGTPRLRRSSARSSRR